MLSKTNVNVVLGAADVADARVQDRSFRPRVRLNNVHCYYYGLFALRGDVIKVFSYTKWRHFAVCGWCQFDGLIQKRGWCQFGVLIKSVGDVNAVFSLKKAGDDNLMFWFKNVGDDNLAFWFKTRGRCQCSVLIKNTWVTTGSLVFSIS